MIFQYMLIDLHSDLYISHETERSCGFLSLGFALVSKHKQVVSDYTNSLVVY